MDNKNQVKDNSTQQDVKSLDTNKTSLKNSRASLAFDMLKRNVNDLNDSSMLSSPINADAETQFHTFTPNFLFKISDIRGVLQKNKIWAKKMVDGDSEFFNRLSLQQQPKLLWIGCSDSRVPANQILSLQPGEVFVHRNIANVVLNSDINCLSVLQFAIEVLKVEHIIVCGHYGCGGVAYSMKEKSDLDLPIIDIWLRTLKDLFEDHEEDFKLLKDDKAKTDFLCELNVANSVLNVCRNSIIQKAWKAGQKISGKNS
ncbi:hypothetical protein HK099_007722 [Clydaea vesicula]|uniref:Carbonic anhydrase n=1 Tax=Clydaea vesicula TaxID=447962 RepID=A0AAD5TWI0_9FUNG|nr:hypothetical protein HK099_007722 [Clydaea vesicula]